MVAQIIQNSEIRQIRRSRPPNQRTCRPRCDVLPVLGLTLPPTKVDMCLFIHYLARTIKRIGLQSFGCADDGRPPHQRPYGPRSDVVRLLRVALPRKKANVRLLGHFLAKKAQGIGPQSRGCVDNPILRNSSNPTMAGPHTNGHMGRGAISYGYCE